MNNLLVYIAKRLVGAAITLFIIITATFMLLRFLPGGPFDFEQNLPAEVKANIEAQYKLNEPILVQYADYLNKLAHFNFGESYKHVGRPISEIISESFPVSFQLGFFALILSFLIGIPLGIFAASQRGKFFDTLAMGLAIGGVSLPSFLMAPIAILIFCFWLNWLPSALWEGPQYYILPVLILGIRPAAMIARLTRSSALDVIHSDFIRTARAKGLGPRMVLFKHVLKNSLFPVLTISGPLVAHILSGSFVVELIFAIPGMGRHVIQSVTNRDYPLVLGLTLLYAVILILANLIVDLLYMVVDPRVKLS